MTNISTYNPEFLRGVNCVFDFIKSGDICWFDRYPFLIIYSNKFEELMKYDESKINEVISLYQSKIFDISHEDKFVLLDVVSIGPIPINIGKFLIEDEIVYITEYDIRDTIITVQTI
jgi:hypothetical protein